MRIRLIYPSWERLRYQTPYVLPPLGAAVVAALTPPEHEVSLSDENLAPVDLDAPADLAAVSTMLISQAPRACAIADGFRSRGVPVVMGGLMVACLPELAARHADAIVLGEAEGVWPQVLADLERKALRPVYRRGSLAGPEEMPAARRDIFKPGQYAYRGLRMMDLVETSRGCRFGCLPCLVPHAAGREHRMRDMAAVVRELRGVECDRVFIVDSALEQNEDHERALFRAMKGLGKSWVGHALSARPDIMSLAAESGCWFVYQAVLHDSPRIREKIRMMHDHGIAVEGTILLGLDEHGPDVFRRMVDFLLECGLDLAEFTVLTPFPGTPLFAEMKKAGRILHEDWGRYNAENVVFRPARMTPEQLAEGCRWAWEAFYEEESQSAKMTRLYRRLAGRGAWPPPA